MFVALVPRMVNEKQAHVDAARIQARDEKNIKTSWFFFYNLGTVVADHLRVSFCHVNEPCKENLDYFSWLSDLHAQTTGVWLIRNLGVSRWSSFSFPIEHFSSHSYMFRTVATVKILLYLMYVLYIRIHTHIQVLIYASLKIDKSPCQSLRRGRGWCRAEMWCKLLSEKSDFPIIAPQRKIRWRAAPCYDVPIWSDRNPSKKGI